MRGYSAIAIPTKPYIKAYILFMLGEKPVVHPKCFVLGSKVYEVLRHSTNPIGTRKLSKHFCVTFNLYIPFALMRAKGKNLNLTNLVNLNRFLEKVIKDRFYELMDEAMEIVPNFRSNLPEVRRKIGISETIWSTDTMRKDYYRYRKKMSVLKEKRIQCT